MASLDIIIPAFNAAHCLGQTLDAIFRQAVPAWLSLGVIVVNNRSTDGTAELIDRRSGEGVRRVDYFDEQSRSFARNAGVAASRADYLLMLDADCQLAGQECLQTVAEAMKSDIDAGFGYATGLSDDFWSRYFRQLESERVRAGWQGWTSQIFLIKREFIESVGGFPTDYTHYGFEDRDFICRLRHVRKSRKLESLTELRVVHDDKTSSGEVFEKMYDSGRYSSGIFKRSFPDEYHELAYAKVDIDDASTFMSLALRLLMPLQPILGRMAAYLSVHRTPLAIGRPLIRLCSALSYFKGTIDRTSDR